MAKRCDLCGKRPMSGNNVSHSKRRTRRRFMPNLQPTHIESGGRRVRATVCTRCIRTATKVR
jgi:large subunit ribosomal protein L28